jgi:hypothetical protein
LPGGTEETTKKLDQDNSSARDLNTGPPKYVATAQLYQTMAQGETSSLPRRSSFVFNSNSLCRAVMRNKRLQESAELVFRITPVVGRFE